MGVLLSSCSGRRIRIQSAAPASAPHDSPPCPGAIGSLIPSKRCPQGMRRIALCTSTHSTCHVLTLRRSFHLQAQAEHVKKESGKSCAGHDARHWRGASCQTKSGPRITSTQYMESTSSACTSMHGATDAVSPRVCTPSPSFHTSLPVCCHIGPRELPYR